MRNRFCCGSFLRSGALIAIGLLVGLAVQERPAQPVAAQERTSLGAEARLRQLQLDLPAVTKPTNTYVTTVRVGDMLYVSGTGPGKGVVGRLGQDYDVKEGKAAARQVGLQVLSAVKAELGSLDKVQRLVKTLGMVNAAPDFKEHPQVINGFSDLMVEVFGEENGKGARSAVGMGSLPGGIPVEIECIFQVRK